MDGCSRRERGRLEAVTATVETSVLVRYFIGTPSEQAARAKRLLDGPGAYQVTEVILVETSHVLRTLYKVPREVIVDSLIDLVRKENISVSALSKGQLVEALLLCRPSGRISIPDALTWAQAIASRSETIYTFDENFPSDGVVVRAP